MNSRMAAKERITSLNWRRLEFEWLGGATMRSLESKYGVSTSTISRRLRPMKERRKSMQKRRTLVAWEKVHVHRAIVMLGLLRLDARCSNKESLSDVA